MSVDPKQIAKVNYDCPTCRGDGQYITCEDWFYNEWAVCLDCDSWEARAAIAALEQEAQ